MTRTLSLLCLVAAGGVLPRSVAAQPAPSPPASTEDDDDVAEVTVHGRGTQRRGASDHDITVGLLRAVPRTSAAEFLSLAPGFYLSQHGGEGKAHQLFLRGFDAQHGQDVEFSLGGLPLNEVSNVHGQGYADLNIVMPEVIDRVRVLEGPYDPHQGDFAVAGSARLDLGVAERGVMLRGAYGMFGTARALALFAPTGMRRETFVAAELYRTAGYGENRAASRASGVGQYVHALHGGGTVRLLAQSYAARFDSPGVVREDDYEAGRQDFYGSYDLRQGGFSSRHSLLAELSIPRGTSRTVVSAFGSLRELRVRENFTGFALDARGDRYEQVYSAATVGLRASHRRRFALWRRWHAWEVGVSARHDITTQSMARQLADADVNYASSVDADVNATDVGVFVDLELRPLPRVTVRGGLRIDGLAYQIDDRSTIRVDRMDVPRGRRDAQGFAIGPRATVEVDLGRGFTVSAAYGKGFRSPQALSLGQGESAPFATVHSGEVGGRFRHRRVEATLAAFVTHVDRDLVFEPTLGTNVVNDASAATTRLGGAFTVRAAILRGLEVSASGTWARATYDATGFNVPYVPPLVGRVDVAFRRDVARAWNKPLTLTAGLGATALGARPLPFDGLSDPLFLLDLGASARLGFVELGVQARNVTDARWRDGVFNYVSNFNRDATTSFVPAEHFTAGRPFTLLSTLTVHL
ncbi:MAG: TonB-dependent receptor [Polyangiales bacterium]